MTDSSTDRGDDAVTSGAPRSDDDATTAHDSELTPSDADGPEGTESSWAPGEGRPSPSVGGGAQDVRPG